MIDTIDFELLVILLLVVEVVVKRYLSVKRSITVSVIDIIDDIRPRLVVIDKANQENKLNNQLSALAALYHLTLKFGSLAVCYKGIKYSYFY